MCGIFGICLEHPEENWTPTDIAQILFPAIRHRGPHAFGWMSWDGEKVEVAKYAGDVGLTKNLENVAVNEQSKWVVGHVRWATHGSPQKLINNHPVRHGNTLGVHNGVLSNWEGILERTGGRMNDECEVDSEAIFAAVDQWGHKAGLAKLRGSMVTVYTKLEQPQHLYVARTTGRDLTIARTKSGNLVFASELNVLKSMWGSQLGYVRTVGTNQLLRITKGKVESKEIFRAVVQAPVPKAPARSYTPLRTYPPYKDNRPKLIPPRYIEPDKPTTRKRSKKGKKSKQYYESDPELRREIERQRMQQRLVREGAIPEKEEHEGMFFYNDQWMTEEEYVDAMMEEAGLNG